MLYLICCFFIPFLLLLIVQFLLLHLRRFHLLKFLPPLVCIFLFPFAYTKGLYSLRHIIVIHIVICGLAGCLAALTIYIWKSRSNK